MSRPGDSGLSQQQQVSSSTHMRFMESRAPTAEDYDFMDFDKGFVETDVQSLATPLPSSNMGYRLALKMGWKEGHGLGKNDSGRTEPIPFDQKLDFLGIGKSEEEDEQHRETTARRRLLDSEMVETEDLKKRREEETKKEEEIKRNLKEINKVFFCALCNKQYVRALEYDNHLSSYDHHHKQRMKEMQESANSKDFSRNKKLEQKREEREQRKIHEQAHAASQKPQPSLPPLTPQPPFQHGQQPLYPQAPSHSPSPSLWVQTQPSPPPPSQPPLPSFAAPPPPLPSAPPPPGGPAPPGPRPPAASAFSFSVTSKPATLKRPAFSMDDD